MGGDFNCPLNPSIDKKGGLLNVRKAVISTIGNLQEELDLVDIWRVKNPEEKSFTWSQNLLIIFCRLDYWLISNALQDLGKVTYMIPARESNIMETMDAILKVMSRQSFWRVAIPRRSGKW